MTIPKKFKQIINHERRERGEREFTDKRGHDGGGGHDSSERRERERGTDRDEREEEEKAQNGGGRRTWNDIFDRSIFFLCYI